MTFEVYCRFCGEWIDTEDIEVTDGTTLSSGQDVIKFAHLDCNPTEQESVVRNN
jgi:hypothetical protein